MASPVTIGTSPLVITSRSNSRVDIRFQNIGETKIYLKKIPLTGTFTPVSLTDFEVVLIPLDDKGNTENMSEFSTNSIARFMAISDDTDGLLAIYETKTT